MREAAGAATHALGVAAAKATNVSRMLVLCATVGPSVLAITRLSRCQQSSKWNNYLTKQYFSFEQTTQIKLFSFKKKYNKNTK